VDPGYNWLITKCTHIIIDRETKKEWKAEYRVKGFREVEPSIVVPTHTTIQLWYAGTLAYECDATLNDVRVNQASAPMPPMPTSPGKIHVSDEVAGSTYQLNAKGARIGTPRRLGESIPILLSEPPPPVSDWSITSSIGVAVIVLAIVVAMIAFVRARNRHLAD